MRSLIITSLLVAVTALVCPGLRGQTPTKEEIKSSPLYYYGEAAAEDQGAAAEKALANLSQQITVTIKAVFRHSAEETNNDYRDTVGQVVTSASTSTLRHVQSIVSKTDNGINVFSYIERTEVGRIINERKLLIGNLFDIADQAESASDFSMALKYYYFASILAKSVQSDTIMHDGKNLVSEIPARINAIISSARFTLIGDKQLSERERELVFSVSVFGRPVQNLDFIYWAGLQQAIAPAPDGKGRAVLLSGSANFDKIDLAVKYDYSDCRRENPAVDDLLGFVEKPSFKNAKEVDLHVSPPPPEKQEEKGGQVEKHEQGKLVLNLANPDGCPVMEKLTDNAFLLLQNLGENKREQLLSKLSNDPFLQRKLNDMFAYNNPVLADDTIRATIGKTSVGWELRKAPVLNYYGTLRRYASEYLVIDFDPEGNLYDVNFGLMENLYEQAERQGASQGDWSNRLAMIKFIEQYRTAFLCRNIAMLDSMFADEAVIIIGRVWKKTAIKDAYRYARLSDAQPDTQFIRLTKTQYLARQKDIFKKHKDIFVGYSNFKISKKEHKAGTYGISMRQSYQSTGYGDEGYLFLLIDFQQKYPQIYVRSWQPKEWNDSALVELSNFHINY